MIKIGLDLGVASIGWSVIEELNKELRILGMGSRVIPLDKDSKDQFSKGDKQTLNANRTLLRSMRKCNFRYKLRRERLREVLPKEMLPTANLFALTGLELYGFRAKAANQRVELPELGRILFHLNQKRGYKSSRKSKKDVDETSEYLKNISQPCSIYYGIRSDLGNTEKAPSNFN
jgi:CRISPR-associated endonuclease Csn1